MRLASGTQRRCGVVLALVLALGVAACGRSATTQESRSTTDTGMTLHVAMMSPSYFALDPQGSYDYPEWELLRCCLVRTLLTYRGVQGVPGTEPVPDLAAAMPTVSADGRTWAFHLRSGIHYAPPLEHDEVTSADVVRALLRTRLGPFGADDHFEGAGYSYLHLIDGYDAFLTGDADAIAGVAAPDPHTLTIHEAHPDRSIAYLFALPFTAPIPPSPSDPSSPLGVATGHGVDAIDRYEQLQSNHPKQSVPPPTNVGYGPFLSATGPYMIEGADEIDYTAQPNDQVPAAGISPSWWDGRSGALTLVRNPSWSAATDPNRPAFADRIDVSILPTSSPYPGLLSGATDTVFGANPTNQQLTRYQTDAVLRGRVHRTSTGTIFFVTMNTALPPFDDVHVRRALAILLDRAAAARGVGFDGQGSLTSHLIPDAMNGGLLASWNPDASAGHRGGLVAARAEMNRSHYGQDGRCAAPACEHVSMGAAPDDSVTAIRAALATLGMSSRVLDPNLTNCFDPRTRVNMCAHASWGTDYPDVGNLFPPFVSTTGWDPSLLGYGPEQLRRWGYDVSHVPSINQDYSRCLGTPAAQQPVCWARLDQLLVSQIVAAIPLFTEDTIRLSGNDVTKYSLDQAWGEPSLDQVAVDRTLTSESASSSP